MNKKTTGIMPTGYVAPYFQNWNDPAVIAWLQRVNGKILGGKRGEFL